MKRPSRLAPRALRWAAAGLLALAASTGAQAEVWGYVDARGVAHFATEKLDERYELFFRGGESFDTAKGVGTPRAVAVPTAPPKLIAFFEVSPSFKQVKHHLREASKQHGVEYELLQALIATESGFDPQAVSPKGAIGLMQVLPATAERYGVTGDKAVPAARKLADPRTNIRAGTRYLRDLIAMFPGRLELALAAYNAGEGAVQRAGNRIPNYPETQKYVKTVLQLYNVLKPPSALGTGGLGSAPAGAAVMGAGRAPQRVRMELPAPRGEALRAAAPAGGAIGRGNLPPAGAAFPLPDLKTERD
jgi:soluble lytic murein transglycosylase-like protein